MKFYICDICQYVTSIPINYRKHMVSQKHVVKQDNFKSLQDDKITCSYCMRKYKHTSSYSKHKTNCKMKKLIDDRIKILEEEILKAREEKKIIRNKIKLETLKMSNKNKDDVIKKLLQDKSYQKLNEINKNVQISNDLQKKTETILNTIVNNTENIQKEKELILEKQIDTLKDFVYGAGNLLKKSMSSINYANTYYKDAEPLIEHSTGLEGFKINNSNNLFQILIQYHENKSLHKLIGDFIISIYKKENPGEQSMWSTDVKRLNYIIRSLCASIDSDILRDDSLKKCIWEVDKSGIKITEFIINPIIKEIKNIIIKEMEKNSLEYANMKINKINEVLLLYDIITEISNSSFIIEINKYIAPHFNLKVNLLE
jgi:hypothetical protein